VSGIIDGGCFAGHDLETGFQCPIEAVIADFDSYGVEAGLVGSYRALYQDARAGNAEAAEWARRFPGRVIPLAILNPVGYGDEPEAVLGWLKDTLGIRVAAIFSLPAYYRPEWDSPAVRRVGRAAARVGVALQAGITTEAELAAVARAWGDLPVPVMIRWMAGHRYKTLAAEAALARTASNMLFDVGNLSSNGGLEQTVARVGAERLFIASNAPHNLGGPPHAILHEARLRADDRARIRRGTLARLLASGAKVSTSSVYETPAWTELRARPKVDIHWHPDHWNLGEPALAVADQIATFDRYGYERVIGSSILALNYDLDAGNAATAAWCDADARAYGLIVVNPLHTEASLAEIERYARHPRFVGVKTIQDVFGIGLDDPAYEPLLVRAGEHGLPMLAHMPGLDRAAARHPAITFVAAHTNWGRAQRFIPLANVCFDFSTGHALRHETQLARFIEAVGPERVMFGSDGSLISPAWSLAKLLPLGLGADKEEAILRTNAYRVFPRLSGRSPAGTTHGAVKKTDN
jgi:hypothetical protein